MSNMVLRDASASKNKFRKLLEQTDCHSALCRSATVTGICLWRISSTPRSPPFSLFSPPPLPFFLLHLFPSSFFTSTSSFPFFPLPPPLSQFSPPPLPPAARLPWPNMWLIGTKAVTKFGQKVWTKVLTNRIEVWPKGATWCEAKCKSCHLLTPDWWCVVPSHHADAGVLCQSKHDIGPLPCDVPCLEANCLFLKGSTQNCSSEEDCKTAEQWLWHKSLIGAAIHGERLVAPLGSVCTYYSSVRAYSVRAYVL